jgi:sarcosine oxidase
MKSFDAIVLGLGGMGSSALYHLAKDGHNVLGIDQFSKAHDLGSSHGQSRLIRQAYFEHEDYVPLLKRSYVLWEELEKLSGMNLFQRNGLIIFGPEHGAILQGIKKSAKLHNIPVDFVPPESCLEKYGKYFSIPDDFSGAYESNAGYLEVESCVLAHLNSAEKLGAKIHTNTPVINWKSNSDGVEVTTSQEKYLAKKLVVTAGAWNPTLLKFDFLKVHRVPLFWFESPKKFQLSEKFPCFAFDMPYGFFYGFPATPSKGLKVAPHSPGPIVPTPSKLDRSLWEEDPLETIKFMKDCIPEVKPTPIDHAICMYTMSPDEHFVIDQHPHFDNVIIGAGFSGHGFKFSPVVGEALSQIAIDGKSQHPIDFLSVSRSTLK